MAVQITVIFQYSVQGAPLPALGLVACCAVSAPRHDQHAPQARPLGSLGRAMLIGEKKPISLPAVGWNWRGGRCCPKRVVHRATSAS